MPHPSPFRRSRVRKMRRRLPLKFDLGKAMFVLPNLFTLSNLFCGFYAVILVAGSPDPEHLTQACIAVFFGALFDAADGRVARLTNTQSSFGVQLDSLTDLVTFGMAPALIVYTWGLSDLGMVGALAAFTYIGCGAIRLARFNVMAERDVKASKDFIGLPIPLAAGLVVSFVLFHQQSMTGVTVKEINILIFTILLSYLMISNIHYRSFKSAAPTKQAWILLTGLGAVFITLSVCFRPTLAFLAFFSGYVLLGIIEHLFKVQRRLGSKTKPP